MARALAILKTLLFTIFVPGVVAGYVPYRLLPPPAKPSFDVIGIIGIVAIAL